MAFSRRLIIQLKESEKLFKDILSEYGDVDIIGITKQHLRALCPIHKERTPSFFVSKLDSGVYVSHCFGCGFGGSVIDFVMEVKRFSFPDAVRYLASRARLSLAGNPKTKA